MFYTTEGLSPGPTLCSPFSLDISLCFFLYEKIIKARGWLTAFLKVGRTDAKERSLLRCR